MDASLAIKVVVPEAGSDKADALFNQWAGEQTQLIAPVFFEVETDSILRQKVSLRRELTMEQAQRAFASLQELPIKTTHSPEQRVRAWEIAREFQFPTVYDATYLALAELHRCEFWTAGRKTIQPSTRQINFRALARKLFSGKLTVAHRQPVTTKSQRSAADAKGAGGATTRTSRNSTKLWILLMYSIDATSGTI